MSVAAVATIAAAAACGGRGVLLLLLLLLLLLQCWWCGCYSSQSAKHHFSALCYLDAAWLQEELRRHP